MQKNSLVFIGLILGLVLGSCSATKRASWYVERAEQLDPSIFKNDTITKLVPFSFYLDTTIKLELKDVLKFDTTPKIVYEKEIVEKKVKLLPSFDTIIRNNKGLTAKIWMNKSVLFSELSIDSIFYKQIKDSIKTEIEQKEIKTTVIIKEKIIWLKWLKIVLISIGILLIIGIAFKIIKLFK